AYDIDIFSDAGQFTARVEPSLRRTDDIDPAHVVVRGEEGSDVRHYPDLVLGLCGQVISCDVDVVKAPVALEPFAQASGLAYVVPKRLAHRRLDSYAVHGRFDG